MPLFNLMWCLFYKKLIWCAWDSNPLQRDGWFRRNHRAMAAPRVFSLLSLYIYIFVAFVWTGNRTQGDNVYKWLWSIKDLIVFLCAFGFKTFILYLFVFLYLYLPVSLSLSLSLTFPIDNFRSFRKNKVIDVSALSLGEILFSFGNFPFFTSPQRFY